MLQVVFWVVLVLAGLAVLALVAVSVVRKALAAWREISVAQGQLAALTAELERLQPPRQEPAPAVFADPAALRAERQRVVRHARQMARRRRR